MRRGRPPRLPHVDRRSPRSRALRARGCWWRSHNVGPVERGARLAAERGCLSCHGPAGRLADPDGTRGIGSVPSFEHDDVTAYAKSEDEIREWILDGKPRRLREEPGGERGARAADARLARPAVARPRSIGSSPT